MAGYSNYPKALRPKSKKVKEKQRAQRQRVRSKAAQLEARKTEKAKSKWDNVKQAVQDVRSSDGLALAGMAFGGKGGPKGGSKAPKHTPANLKKMAELQKRFEKLEITKPGQKITRGPIAKANKNTPKTDYDTRNLSRPKRQKKSKKELENRHAPFDPTKFDPVAKKLAQAEMKKQMKIANQQPKKPRPPKKKQPKIESKIEYEQAPGYPPGTMRIKKK